MSSHAVAASPADRAWTINRAAVVATAAVALAAILALDPFIAAPILGIALAVVVSLLWPLAGLVALAFAVPWAGGVDLIPPPFPVTLADVLVASVGAAFLVRWAVNRENLAAGHLWTPYILLYLGAIALSVTQAADWHASLRELVKWGEMLVVFLVASAYCRTRGQLQMLLTAIVLAGVSQALYGYVQFLFGLGPEAFAAHRFALRAFGSFDQPNPYAGFLNMTFPFALTLAILSGRPRVRVLYGAGAVLIAGAILASESRGALLAGFCGSCIVVGAAVPQLRTPLWFGVVAVLTGAWFTALGLVSTGPFQRVLNAVGLGGVSFGNVTDANFSAVERAAHWLAGVRMFADHPVLGVGIGNYSSAYPRYHPRGWYASLEHAHNYFINVAAEAGVVGLAAYVLLTGSALWYSCAAIRLSSDRHARAATLGVLGAVIATTLHNLFDVLYVHGMVAFLGLLMAIVPVVIRMASSPMREMEQGHTG